MYTYPDKCWFAVLCPFWLQCGRTLLMRMDSFTFYRPVLKMKVLPSIKRRALLDPQLSGSPQKTRLFKQSVAVLIYRFPIFCTYNAQV